MPPDEAVLTPSACSGHKRRGRVRVLVAACLAIVLVVIVAVVWRSLKAELKTKQCRENLKKIALALHAYHERYQAFPPAYIADSSGQPMHSWRVLLLPFLGYEDLYRSYRMDEPWDGPNNLGLATRMPSIYGCPSVPGQDPTVTNYLAVVGPETAWPEGYAMTIRDILDGTAQTVQVVESADSVFCWLEPRDLSIDEASEGVNPESHPSIGSRHRSGAHLLFADTTVRFVPATTDLRVLGACFTANQGRPLDGVSWPAEKLSVTGDFPSARPAGEMTETDILPHTRGEIAAGRNHVYCAAFQLAWNELQDRIVGGPIELAGSPPMASELNRQNFRQGDLSKDSFVAMAGAARDGIVDRIRSEMSQKFPTASPRLLGHSEGYPFFAYAYLEKTLPFAVKFDRLMKPLRFQTNHGPIPVASFGIKEFGGYGLRDERLMEQVTILDYVSDDDFVLRLVTKSDELILAKVTPKKSFADTIAAVTQRIREPTGSPVRSHLQKDESLIVPKIGLNVDREYSELVNRLFQNQGWTGFHIGSARQGIRFLLNESGARLVSEAAIAMSNGHPPAPPKPRHFVFDKPFLIYLRERQAEQPYFAIWVENAEVLEKFREKLK